MGNSKATPKPSQKASPLPICRPYRGQNSNGSVRWFILLDGAGLNKSNPVFLTFKHLVAFETPADAELFCQMANASFLSFPFTQPKHKTNAHKTTD